MKNSLARLCASILFLSMVPLAGFAANASCATLPGKYEARVDDTIIDVTIAPLGDRSSGQFQANIQYTDLEGNEVDYDDTESIICRNNSSRLVFHDSDGDTLYGQVSGNSISINFYGYTIVLSKVG